jgi:hypothetical protein
VERASSAGRVGRLGKPATLVLAMSGLGLGFALGLSVPVVHVGLAPGFVARITPSVS